MEQAVIIGIKKKNQLRATAEESLMELDALVRSAGASVAERVFCAVDRIHAATFVGQGKVRQITEVADSVSADLIVFDEPLSPAQQRNLEKICNRKILDRTGIILDIFAMRARTREGKIQVELAQLEYTLPRLTRMWQHLSRLGAGIGTRGPGETQLEVDRRKIRQRIDKLRDDLVKVRNRRRLQRQGRRRAGFTSVAIVGYTNAGKSTLMNTLTGASIPVEDRLFATLDPTIRVIELPSRRRLILSDTVGFIAKLPHQLVEAFRATLEEVVEADLLLHVLDASSPEREMQIEAVEGVLEELGADGKPVILVYNKIDRCPELRPGRISDGGEDIAVAASALDGRGIPELMEVLTAFEERRVREVTFQVPYNRPEVLAGIRAHSEVITERFLDTGTEITVRIEPAQMNRYQQFIGTGECAVETE